MKLELKVNKQTKTYQKVLIYELVTVMLIICIWIIKDGLFCKIFIKEWEAKNLEA